ncbi:molecular chaperone DnaK [Streptomyces neyagawaensis]|uniref:molecular chaperone DnaK n=2 Tax=Streptomyces neyagawaensis TaxID=42238 RepID=UPI00201D0E16|nr:molecular chaperone DnaK [Streptomyces neyagawaensis]MCL6733215.1 molecular chaperone DnaK [Streptomyces neyagawaensis]MDE1685017.1 molecular chaperone DnaK [Streptomyces neyagawaensis]
MARAVGIDLGTAHSVVSVLEGGDPTVITNAEGARSTPSVVAFTKSGEVLVGEAAKRQAVINAARTICSVKRHMGTGKKVRIDGTDFTPQQISAFILQKLKRDAESYLGERVTDAVITVPAHFGYCERRATKEAGRIAGLNVLRIVSEPTAAALAYGLDRDEETVMVIHFGGGTFDVSLLEISDGVVEVKATSGDNALGGDDWDQRMVDYLVKRFADDHGVDLAKDRTALRRLREAAQRAKVELSSTTETTIELPYIAASAQGPLHLESRLTRDGFQQLTADLLERCKAPFYNVIKHACVELGEIDHVILVGGSTRMPAVIQLVDELTGGKERRRVRSDDPVAVGAALQSGILKGEVQGVMLLDCSPLSLGIETKGGVMTKLIERNTTIPTKRSEIFTTTRDHQTALEVKVYEGEHELTAHNKKIATVALNGLPPAKAGELQIEVSFDIDGNGIMHVSAKDLRSGKEQRVAVTGESVLREADLERLEREAARYDHRERQRRASAEIRDQAHRRVHIIEASLRDHAGAVPGDIEIRAEAAVRELKEALENGDDAAVREATEKAATIAQLLHR